MKVYQIADTDNGVLETYTNFALASLVYDEYVQAGIKEELSIQDETGLTDEQIQAKVTSFYCLIVNENFGKY